MNPAKRHTETRCLGCAQPKSFTRRAAAAVRHAKYKWQCGTGKRMRDMIWQVVYQTKVCPWTGESDNMVVAPVVLGEPISETNIVCLHKSVESRQRPEHVVRMAKLIAARCSLPSI